MFKIEDVAMYKVLDLFPETKIFTMFHINAED